MVLTSHGKHSLNTRYLETIRINLSGTGHHKLNTSETLRLRARVIGEERLELLDGTGNTLSGSLEASMGVLSLSPFRTLLHTGGYVPVIFLAPILIGASLAGFLAIALQTHHLNDLELAALAVSTSTIAVFTSAIASTSWKMLRSKAHLTPLKKKLAAFHSELLKANPKPRPCAKGPGRALMITQILDLHDFFDSLILSRSMYYVEPNIIKPLTAFLKLSYAEVAGPSYVEWFISHYWGASFTNTCAALVKLARSGNSDRPQRSVAVWVCTFSINQYDVKSELAGSSWEQSSFYLALTYSTCCGTCMIMDQDLHPLRRSWCLFELLHSMLRQEDEDSRVETTCYKVFFATSSGVLNLGEASMDVSLSMGESLARLRLEDASASNSADKQMIDTCVVSKMGSFDEINMKMRRHMRGALEASQQAADRDFDRVRIALNSMDTSNSLESHSSAGLPVIGQPSLASTASTGDDGSQWIANMSACVATDVPRVSV